MKAAVEINRSMLHDLLSNLLAGGGALYIRNQRRTVMQACSWGKKNNVTKKNEQEKTKINRKKESEI